jgi:3-mercaptopyruvate sulfurtransferase SseA
MLPSVDAFERAMSKLGITEQDHITVYDSKGLFRFGCRPHAGSSQAAELTAA